MFKFERTLHTDGLRGLWSNHAAAVSTLRMTVDYINDEQDFGELRVHFNTDSWNVNEHGLIYTDRQWIKELREQLDLIGFPGKDVDYSEQGMQGDDYVSLDVGGKFLKTWLKKVDETIPSL
jgi:hypothetical protein